MVISSFQPNATKFTTATEIEQNKQNPELQELCTHEK
jgi:hypothetical protein